MSKKKIVLSDSDAALVLGQLGQLHTWLWHTSPYPGEDPRVDACSEAIIAMRAAMGIPVQVPGK